MPRIRSIKPEFFTSLTIAGLSLPARLTFIGLWTHVDDAGRCVDDARLIRAAVWPLDDRLTSDMEEDLKELTEASLIAQYEASGRRYIAVKGWSEHQRINRPTPSKLPAPPEPRKAPLTSGDAPTGTAHGGLTEDSLAERKGKERKGKEQGKEEEPSSAIASAIPDADQPSDRPDVNHLCDLLVDLMVANGCRRPRVGAKWRDAARLLLDADGIEADMAERVMCWALNDSFWKANIQSMPTFRAKFDRLRLAARHQWQQNQLPHARRPSTTDERVAAAQALKTPPIEQPAIGGS